MRNLRVVGVAQDKHVLSFGGRGTRLPEGLARSDQAEHPRMNAPTEDLGSTNNEKELLTMNWIHIVSYFFGGAFLENALPHFVSGAMGRPFQSPFAKPPGEGFSSSTVNVLWGFFNLVIGYLLVCRVGNFDLRSATDIVALGLGVFLIGLMSARGFGRFNGGNSPGDVRGSR